MLLQITTELCKPVGTSHPGDWKHQCIDCCGGWSSPGRQQQPQTTPVSDFRRYVIL